MDRVDRWTFKDKCYAKKAYQDGILVEDIAKAIGRTLEGTRSQIGRMGGKREHVKAWTTTEIAKLHSLYPDPCISSALLLKTFAPRRPTAIRAKAKKLGLHRARVTGKRGCGLVRKLAAIINQREIASSAIFEEAGFNRASATEWFVKGTDPLLSNFSRVLAELGLRLEIVETRNL